MISKLESDLDAPLRDIIPTFRRGLRRSTYFGIPTLKSPTDAWIYQEILAELRPDIVVEIGTFCGGSTLYLAHLMDSLEHGHILAVDVNHSRLDIQASEHPRITPITGGAIEVQPAVALACGDHSTSNPPVILVIEDSSHRYDHTLAVLRAYSALVTPGSLLIVEDTICHHGSDQGPKPGPHEAVEAFLAEDAGRDFEIDRSRERFLITWNPHGYLRRRT